MASGNGRTLATTVIVSVIVSLFGLLGVGASIAHSQGQMLNQHEAKLAACMAYDEQTLRWMERLEAKLDNALGVKP